jgi:hypothetical protein
MPPGTDSPRSPPRRSAPAATTRRDRGPSRDGRGDRAPRATARRVVIELLDEPSTTCAASPVTSENHQPRSSPDIPEPREQGLRPSGDPVPSSALMSALTTENYTHCSCPSSAAHSSPWRWSPSSTGSATPSCPASAADARRRELRAPGDLAVHGAYYARAIGRIRSFYFDVAGPGPATTGCWAQATTSTPSCGTPVSGSLAGTAGRDRRPPLPR